MKRGWARLVVESVILGVAICVAASCADAPPAQERAGEASVAIDTLEAISPVVTFGWPELSDSTRALEDLEREYAAGVLGNIAGIAEGPSGEVYVLDRAWQKVVVFDSKGTYRRIILGGHGSGPGEFQVARALAVSPTGKIGVLDEGSNRVTVFSGDGALQSSVPLMGRLPLRLALDEHSAWVLHATYSPGVHVIYRYSLDTGEVIDSTGLVNEPIASYMSHGEPGAITVSKDLRLIWALPRSGLLRIFGHGADTTVGKAIFPEAVPTITVEKGIQVRGVPVGVRGVATMGESVILYHFRRVPPRQEGQPSGQELLLSIYADEYTRAKHISFGDQRHWPAGFAASRDGSALYIARAEPYPHVEKYVLPSEMRM